MISYLPARRSDPRSLPRFTYTGEYRTEVDAFGWQLFLLSSGTLTFEQSADVDIFLVGGGGRGGSGVQWDDATGSNEIKYWCFGGGGGGGYTTNVTKRLLGALANNVVIGDGGISGSYNGGNTTFVVKTGADTSETIVAEGGKKGSNNNNHARTTVGGGNGGSGGAKGHYYGVYKSNGGYYGGRYKLPGGTDGNDAGTESLDGKGQHTTTKSFADESGTLYASGGGSYYSNSDLPAIVPNSGNGGGGSVTGQDGASGIVIIRNAR